MTAGATRLDVRAPVTVHVDSVRRLLDAGAQLLEALPLAEYEWSHLPGAVRVPLGDLGAGIPPAVDPARPIVVYCHDYLWDLSARASWRLALAGAAEVYDYAVGKTDWLAHGLPYEGTADLVARHLEPVAVCAPAERVSAVVDRQGDVGPVAVVAEDGLLLGRLSTLALREHRARDATALEVADPAPVTVRPMEERGEAEEHLAEREAHHVLVTTPAGKLLGLFRRH